MPFPEDLDIQRIQPGRLEADVRGDFADAVHLGQTWCEYQVSGSELCAVLCLGIDHPVLLAGGVGVVRTDLDAGLGNFVSETRERSDRVEHDLSAAKCLHQRLFGVLDLDDIVFDGVDTGDHVENALDSAFVASSGQERDVELPQVFTDQSAGVSRCPIYDDPLVGWHESPLVNSPHARQTEVVGIGAPERG